MIFLHILIIVTLYVKMNKKHIEIQGFLALLTIVINYIKNSQKNSKKDLKIL